MFTSGKFDMKVIHSDGDSVWSDIKYCWSGIYEVSLNEDSRGWKWVNAEDYDYWTGFWLGFYTNSSKKRFPNYYHPGNRGDYYVRKDYSV